jgi:4-hydroxyphenylpyruvate dioxygenase-like putative hemolysin
MADLFENPMGLDGFEFVEFESMERDQLRRGIISAEGTV